MCVNSRYIYIYILLYTYLIGTLPPSNMQPGWRRLEVSLKAPGGCHTDALWACLGRRGRNHSVASLLAVSTRWASRRQLGQFLQFRLIEHTRTLHVGDIYHSLTRSEGKSG